MTVTIYVWSDNVELMNVALQREELAERVDPKNLRLSTKTHGHAKCESEQGERCKSCGKEGSQRVKRSETGKYGDGRYQCPRMGQSVNVLREKKPSPHVSTLA
jgi:hypothetical protein